MSVFKESKASGRLICEERKRLVFFGLPFTFTKYVLTEKKLILLSGLLTETEEEILLYRVVDITKKRTLLQKLFKLGTIIVSAQDKSIPKLEIKNIKNCNEFKDLLSEQIEHEKARLKVRTGEYVALTDHDDCNHPGFDDGFSDDSEDDTI